jgi:hypothetical protein
VSVAHHVHPLVTPATTGAISHSTCASLRICLDPDLVQTGGEKFGKGGLAVGFKLADVPKAKAVSGSDKVASCSCPTLHHVTLDLATGRFGVVPLQESLSD